MILSNSWKLIAAWSVTVLLCLTNTHNWTVVFQSKMRTHETGVAVYYQLSTVYFWQMLSKSSMGLLIAEMKKMTVFETQYISKLLSCLELCIIQPGMTNYRIDRIGTHRHASTPNSTTSTRHTRGRCMKVRFHGTNIRRTVTGMNNS